MIIICLKIWFISVEFLFKNIKVIGYIIEFNSKNFSKVYQFWNFVDDQVSIYTYAISY